MVDAASSRPPGLRPPSGGEVSNLKILVDLGPDAPVDVLSGRIDDLSIVVEVGHRWGVDLARSAASLDLSYEIERGGPAALDDLLRREGWLRHGRRSWRRHRLEFFEFGWAGEDPEWVTLRDSRAERLLGLPTTVRHLEYSNPLELVLGGSGILFLGVVMAARLVRDWSTSRRTNVAVAREAEAVSPATRKGPP